MSVTISEKLKDRQEFADLGDKIVEQAEGLTDPVTVGGVCKAIAALLPYICGLITPLHTDYIAEKAGTKKPESKPAEAATTKKK